MLDTKRTNGDSFDVLIEQTIGKIGIEATAELAREIEAGTCSELGNPRKRHIRRGLFFHRILNL